MWAKVPPLSFTSFEREPDVVESAPLVAMTKPANAIAQSLDQGKSARQGTLTARDLHDTKVQTGLKN